MSATIPQATITISLTDLEALIRRTVQEAVREAVHEELLQLFRHPRPSIAEDWTQEGPDDPEGDAALLAEALEIRRLYRTHQEQRMDWADFKAELKKAEDAGELPH
ncbi:MAG: hypothetical protein U0350_41565 [Caldilineaceae bacterium]